MQTLSGGWWYNMNSDNRYLVVLLALVMLVGSLAGCVSEGDESDWKNPTGLNLADLSVNETGQKVEVDISLDDKDDMTTKADGTLRVAVWDSTGFEMLNKTWEVSKKDFFGFIFIGIKISQYTLEIPFADFAKSHDRSSGSGDGTMHAMAWFTWKDQTFTDDYDLGGFLNPDIPDALLHPNEAPMADLVVNNPGWVGFDVMCDGSGSSDPEGGVLSFEWDWGDGETTTFLATAEETHAYDEPGTYTITMKVIDGEDAEASRTMDVTVDWPLGITVDSWGVVTEGDHVNETYVEMTITNQADEEVSLATDDFWLLDDATGREAFDSVDPALPASLAAAGSATVMVYFDLPDGFTATKVEAWGREFTLP